MIKRLSICLTVVMLAGGGVSSVQQRDSMPAGGSVACRHDGSESQADRTRRIQALALAKAINSAQGELAERTRRYHPLTALRNLPPVPTGFELRLYSEVDGYLFSLKDALDTCRYAIFSDQSGLVYEKAARTHPINAQ